MSIQTSSSYECQSERQKAKTIDQQMKNLAIHGAGMSPWEADILVKMINDVYFQHNTKQLVPGQMLHSCVATKEGAGKPLSDCAMETVVLTIFDPEDEKELPHHKNKQRQIIQRQRRMIRMTDEARDQGGLLSQEDLAKLCQCDVKTIQRATDELRKNGIILPTRGQQKDIGPGITHRELIIRHWIEGKEEVELCTATKHSMEAIERYLRKFKVCVFLRLKKQFTDHEIAVVSGISSRAVKVFLEIYDQFKNKDFFKHRRDEIMLTGSNYYQEVGEKKDSQLTSM